jgi:hypothetical protein
MQLEEPDTVAVSGDALADLLASSVESTVVIDSTVVPAREKTERTFLPPQPSSRRDLGSISFAPVAYTPRSVIVAPPQAKMDPATRAVVSLAIGVGMGLLAALGVGATQQAAAASATVRVVRSASDEKLAIGVTLHDKAASKRHRVMTMRAVAQTQTPASAAPATTTNLDALGDAQLGRPF